MKVIKFIFFVSVINVVVLSSCKKDDEDKIRINADLPEFIQLGGQDTLKFNITSEEPIIFIELKEEETVYARFEEDVIGENVTEFNVNFIFTPNVARTYLLDLYARNRDFYNTTYSFAIEVN